MVLCTQTSVPVSPKDTFNIKSSKNVRYVSPDRRDHRPVYLTCAPIRIMKEHRFKENREHRFTISKPTLDDPVLVLCPNCAQKAFVVPYDDDRVRCSCFECGYTAENPTNGRSFYWYNENPTDGYFGFDLWLKTNCGGHPLWAFNIRHLEFLESYVSAKHREREMDEKRGWHNSSLASRLPKWMKSGKNREALLKAIRELKAKA